MKNKNEILTILLTLCQISLMQLEIITKLLENISIVFYYEFSLKHLAFYISIEQEINNKLMEFYERISGARMYANLIKPGNIILNGFLNDLDIFCKLNKN